MKITISNHAWKRFRQRVLPSGTRADLEFMLAHSSDSTCHGDSLTQCWLHPESKARFVVRVLPEELIVLTCLKGRHRKHKGMKGGKKRQDRPRAYRREKAGN